MNDTLTLLLGVTGALLYYLHKKRKFDRTNKYGVEQFPGVLKKLSSTTIDHLLRATGIVCFWTSALIFGAKYAEEFMGIVFLFGLAFIIEEYFWRPRRSK
jgi:hypothetical protein